MKIYLALLFISACASAQPQPILVPVPEQPLSKGDRQPNIYTNEADMDFTIDGKAYKGTAVVPHKSPRLFKFSLLKNTDFIDIKTCHRFKRFPVNGATVFEYNYIPRPNVEMLRACPMAIDAVTKEGLLKSAIVDFVDKETMDGYNNCNGEIALTSGATICQSPIDLKQMLQLTEDVDAVTSVGCSPMQCVYEFCYYLMSPGSCIYAIKGIVTGTRHRLLTRGFTVK